MRCTWERRDRARTKTWGCHLSSRTRDGALHHAGMEQCGALHVERSEHPPMGSPPPQPPSHLQEAQQLGQVPGRRSSPAHRRWARQRAHQLPDAALACLRGTRARVRACVHERVCVCMSVCVHARERVHVCMVRMSVPAHLCKAERAPSLL